MSSQVSAKNTNAHTESMSRNFSASNQSNTVRYLVNVGVFTAVYIVIAFASGMIGIISPIASIAGWCIGIIANSIVITLFIARTPVIWGIPLVAVLLGIFMTATGHSAVVILGALISGALAAVVSKAGNFISPLLNALAYGLFSIWMVSPILPMLWARNDYIKYVQESMKDERYAHAWDALFSPTFIFIWAIIVFLLGFLCGFIGNRVLSKHFRRAGLA